jgi:hypothetical protein
VKPEVNSGKISWLRPAEISDDWHSIAYGNSRASHPMHTSPHASHIKLFECVTGCHTSAPERFCWLAALAGRPRERPLSVEALQGVDLVTHYVFSFNGEPQAQAKPDDDARCFPINDLAISPFAAPTKKGPRNQSSTLLICIF